MKEATCIVLGLLLAYATSENPGPHQSWRAPWKQQNRVQAHSGLTVVSPPRLAPTRLSRRGGPLPGYLPLRPVPSPPRNPRWFGSETAPKATYARPPPSYERFPPFWSNDNSNHVKSHRPQPHRHAKKECNPCNSVPWTPIFKSPAGLSGDHKPRELVPLIEIYPEPSIQQASIVAPQFTNDLVPPSIVDTTHLVSLPAGNHPVAPELLLPPQHHITFPELSPQPLAPIHNNVPFHPDPQGLVPPVAPAGPVHVAPIKSTSNVVVTISEPEPPSPQNVHISPQDQHSESSSFVDSHAPINFHNYQPTNNGLNPQDPNNFHSYRPSNGLNPHDANNFHNYQQSTGLNSHDPSNFHNFHRPTNNGLDIVKSVPLAEYTSSIQYPLQVIESSPYIDINGPPNSQQNTGHFTYEKLPQTGNQKVSDFILGVSKDSESKKTGVLDNSAAGSDKVSAQTISTEVKPVSDELTKGTRHEDTYDPNILTAPPLPPHLTQLLPTYETAFLHPLFPHEHQDVASAVNGDLLPPAAPQPLNPIDPAAPPKKIQIIIPYTTYNNNQNNELDQNAVGTSQQNSTERYSWPPIVVGDSPQNLPRKVPETQNFQQFTNAAWNDGQPSETNRVQHILASNIRDLLKKEVEPKQNIRLQKNIDNWTALEYSNHKTVGKKQPSDVISHAQAVTSIPGTSISHLLLPSKKIPDGYFTTPRPLFDEPGRTPFPATAVSVNSQPFTTVSKYSTVAWAGPTMTRRQGVHHQFTTPQPHDNEIHEDTTPGQRWSDLKVSIAPGTNEKVYVVTPESYEPGRRSTRHIDTTEKYSAEASQNSVVTKLEKVANVSQTEAPVEKSKAKQKPLYPKSTPLFRVKANQTRYEKISKFNKPKPIDKFFATTTKPLTENTPSSSPKPTTVAKTTTEAMSTTPAAFPFRNGGELPVEMANAGLSSSQLTFKNAGSRKTLIKQVKTSNRKVQGDADRRSTSTTEESAVNQPDDAPLEVEVVYPVKSAANKKGDAKKATTYSKKKSVEKVVEKPIIKTDEPNITEDDREHINSLTNGTAVRAEVEDAENETLLAVETSGPPVQVDSESQPGNSSSRSLLDTIKLLRDFLAETSEEDSKEKTEQIGRVIQKIDAKGKLKKEKKDETYKYNFPEYLRGELNLSKDEMNLVENAMVELRKQKKMDTT